MLNWKKTILNIDNAYAIPNNWLFIHYYEALVTLFRIENAMRIFVYSILKSEFKNLWVNQNIYNSTDTIESISKERINRDIKHGYIGFNITCPIMHLMLGELIYLIFNNWELFKAYFPGEKQIMKYKLNEITNVRNSFAHFRPIQESDLELIKQNSRHVLIEVDRFITDMLTCFTTVPSNTSSDWYKKFTTLNNYCSTIYNNFCNYNILEDRNQKWITIVLSYSCQVHTITSWPEHKYYNLLNLNSSNLIKQIPRILKNVTYVSETTFGNSILINNNNNGLNTPYSKSIRLSFKREAIEKEYNEIYHDLYKISKKIHEETNMVMEDINARGEIVHSFSIWASQLKDANNAISWQMNDNLLLTNVQENDPPEFWGYFDSINNFITNAHNYPWMGTAISNVSRLDE